MLYSAANALLSLLPWLHHL